MSNAPRPLPALTAALKLLAHKAGTLDGAGRIPNVLMGLVLVVERAKDERCPELLTRSLVTVRRLREQHEAREPEGALATILGDAVATIEEAKRRLTRTLDPG
jgi:hypothetical protein